MSNRIYSTKPIYYTYQLRLDNSDMPFYVGKGQFDRTQEHFYPSELKKKSHKNHIILKAQREGIDVLVDYIEKGMTEAEAFGLEITCIALYGRIDKGTGILANHTDGGEGPTGSVRSEEFKGNLRYQFANANKVICVYCNKEMHISHYTQSHKGGSCLNRKTPLSKNGKPNYHKKVEKLTCEHCNIQISKGIYVRWHGDNCKMKLQAA